MGQEKATVSPGIKLLYINATEEEEEEMLQDFCADEDIVEMEPLDVLNELNQGVQEVIEDPSYADENVSFREVTSPQDVTEEDSETWYEKNQKRLKKRSGAEVSENSKKIGVGLIVGGVLLIAVIIFIVLVIL